MSIKKLDRTANITNYWIKKNFYCLLFLVIEVLFHFNKF